MKPELSEFYVCERGHIHLKPFLRVIGVKEFVYACGKSIGFLLGTVKKNCSEAK